MNAPTTLQRIVEVLFENPDFLRLYIDDMAINSRSIEIHTYHPIVFCDHVRKSGLYNKLTKCILAVPQVELLEYSVSENVVEPDQ